MSMKKLGGLLGKIGAFVTVAAVLWWAYTYGEMALDHFTRAVSCLYSSGGLCGLASGLSSLGGAVAYDPAVFWAGIGLLVVGLLMRAVGKR